MLWEVENQGRLGKGIFCGTWKIRNICPQGQLLLTY